MRIFNLASTHWKWYKLNFIIEIRVKRISRCFKFVRAEQEADAERNKIVRMITRQCNYCESNYHANSFSTFSIDVLVSQNKSRLIQSDKIYFLRMFLQKK